MKTEGGRQVAKTLVEITHNLPNYGTIWHSDFSPLLQLQLLQKFENLREFSWIIGYTLKNEVRM